MPALDYCHPIIVRALQKDGWTVEEKPAWYLVDRRTVYIDIRASRGMNGRLQQLLLAEAKCFPDRNSTTRELYEAIGQYIIYRAILAESNTDIPLYLAIPEAVYTAIFDSTVRRAISDNGIKLIIVNLETETIRQWIE